MQAFTTRKTVYCRFCKTPHAPGKRMLYLPDYGPLCISHRNEFGNRPDLAEIEARQLERRDIHKKAMQLLKDQQKRQCAITSTALTVEAQARGKLKELLEKTPEGLF